MIEIKQHLQVTEWVLNAAPCNEIGLSMLAALENAVALAQKNKPKALMIRSAISGGFCAGADLKALYLGLINEERSHAQKELSSFIDRVHTVFNAIDAFSFPTIGVLHGVCFGGGLELALTFDVLIAEQNLRIAFPELRLGIIPGFGGIPRLRREVGNSAIRDLLFTGRSLNALKTLQLGLVSQVVADGQGANVALKMATHMSKYAPEVVELSKQFTKPIPLKELEEEKLLFLKMAQSPELLSALKSFYNSQDVRPYVA